MDTFIFDMDGTIFDTESFYYQTWIEIAKTNGFEFSLENKMELSGRRHKEAVSYIIDTFNMSKDEAKRIISDLNELRTKGFKEFKGSFKKEGLIEILTYLKKNKKKIGLASSSTRKKINFLLDREKVGEYFDTIISSDDIVKAKPDPEIFNLTMERLNAKKERTYIVEDSLAGIEAAKKSGALAVLILDLDKSEKIKSKADLVFNSLNEFLDFIKKREVENESRNKTFKIKCPSCKKTFEKELPTAIFRNNKSFDLIKEDRIGLLTCPFCQHNFRLNYRFVYTDYDKKLIFVNDPKFEKKINQLAFKSSLKLVGKIENENMNDFLIRMSTNAQSLIEKVRIFEDKKLDNIIEIMKVLIEEDENFKIDPKTIRGFYYENKKSFKIITEEKSFKIDFIEEVYKMLFEKYHSLIDEKEISLVDKSWAYDMIKTL